MPQRMITCGVVLLGLWLPAWAQSRQVVTTNAGSVAATTTAPGTRIEWDADKVSLSRMIPYKYVRLGQEYVKPSDPNAPDPGVNYMIELESLNQLPVVYDRVPNRDAVITGGLASAPTGAHKGRAWLEDNYGRVLDETALAGPEFGFRLAVQRSLHLGVYLKADLKDAAGAVVWAGQRELRLVPPPEDPWREFFLGVYNGGRRPGTADLFRQAGLSHMALRTTNDPADIAQADMRFHSSNILFSLIGLYHRDYGRYWKIVEAERANRGAVTIARDRCLSSPKEEKFLADILTAAAMRFEPFQPLHYSIADEIGIADMTSPHDMCGSEWCRRRFAQWLQQRYGNIERLNAQWGSTHRDFAQTPMCSNWQALDLAKAPRPNFSPWADRVEFMDEVLYGAIAKGVKTIRDIDPAARCNVSGVQPPACWQSDHWKLTRTVNCLTPYDLGESADVAMSFFDDGRTGKIIGLGLGKTPPWRAFLRGSSMVQGWDEGKEYSRLIDIERQGLTPDGQAVRAWSDWVRAGPGRLRNRAQRFRDPVAFLYSQPSQRGNWIIEVTSRPDVEKAGQKWIERDYHGVWENERSFRVRVSWSMWMHDVGIFPKYVNTSQVEESYLEKNGYKVLVLGRCVALSEATAAAIRKFAEAGGTVIADALPGIMDEHCRVRANGALDDLFGVTRGDWRALEVPTVDEQADPAHLKVSPVAFEKTLRTQGGEAGATSTPITTRVGSGGKAIYLNLNMEHYLYQRLSPERVAPDRRALLALLAEAGVKPVFTLTELGGKEFHPVGQDISLYRSGRGWLAGVTLNPSAKYGFWGKADCFEGFAGNPYVQDNAADLHVPPGLWVYDLVERQALGKVASVRFISRREGGRMYACWPFSIDDVNVRATVTGDAATTPARHVLGIRGEIVTSAPVADERLVAALRVRRADGSEQVAYRRTLDCAGNSFAADIPLGLNEHGRWRVEILEPCTGKIASTEIDIP